MIASASSGRTTMTRRPSGARANIPFRSPHAAGANGRAKATCGGPNRSGGPTRTSLARTRWSPAEFGRDRIHRPSRVHTGLSPPSAPETLYRGPGLGNGRTCTSHLPVSCDWYASHRPSGENAGAEPPALRAASAKAAERPQAALDRLPIDRRKLVVEVARQLLDEVPAAMVVAQVLMTLPSVRGATGARGEAES